MLTAQLPDGRVPVLISAHAGDLVRAEAAAVMRYLQSRTDPVGVAAVSAMLRRTRPVRAHRAVVRAHDDTELTAGLAALCDGDDHPLVSRSDRRIAARTVFVCPGQGTQWPGMGAELLDIAAYRAEAQRCDQAFRALGRGEHGSPLAYLRGTHARQPGPALVQAAQFTHAAALAATWRGCGVSPDLTVGHSLGELAAAYIAGAVDLPAAAAVVVARSVVTDSWPGRCGMAMLSLGADAAAELIAALPGWLELSVVNGPESVVVSGELDAVRAAVAELGDRGIFARELTVNYPGHTSALVPLRTRMLELLPNAEFHQGPVEFIGSVLGGPIPPGTDFGQYWYANLRNPVRFDLAAAAALARGATSFIEMSAHPTLLAALADSVGDAQVLGSTVRDRPAGAVLSANIAEAAVADPGYRWQNLPAAGGLLRGFPHAPMHARKLWAKPEPLQPTGEPVTMTEHWVPAGGHRQRRAETVAVIDYCGQSAGLTAQLEAAASADTRTSVADPADAELLVLVAPSGADADIVAATTEFADRAAAQTAVAPGARCRRVWLVTTGAEQIGTDPAPRPVPAALAALHRGTGFGYHDQTFAHLDLTVDPTAADIHAGLTGLLGPDTEVAVRAGQLVARRLRRAAPAPPDAVPPAVVITGGTGAIGLAYAAFCADRGARDIVLLSRSGATGATATRLAATSARTGAQITAIGCDLTDADAVRSAVAQHHPRPADLVVHAASAPAVAADEVTAAAVREAFGAKVIGLHNLADAWPLRPGATVLVCSSVLALWGGSGHGLYAAANRMTDALTAGLRSRGVDARSIRWGLWQTVAVVTGAEQDRIARVGLTPMAPDAAIAASLSARHAEAILAADWDRLARFFDGQGVPWPFGEPEPARRPAAKPDRPLHEVVAAELATVLRTGEPGDVDLHRPLVELGLDSLLALDLRKRLGRATGRRVALGPLLAGITGTELVAGLATTTDGAGTGKDRADD
jgi:mycobactin polyketide synthetase MbtD